MKIGKLEIVGTVFGIIFLLAGLLLKDTPYFYLLAGLGIIVLFIPFVFSAVIQGSLDSEKEEMFLEFSRNLVESVKTGTPISKSIINMRSKDFGVLTPHIKKLANQISMGISLTKALRIFDKDLDNKIISRAVTLIGEAERAGGEIGKILEAVTEAVSLSDRLKKERKAAISTMVTQGYIIFLVFTIIILVMQFKIIPMLSGISNVGTALASSGVSSGGSAINAKEISNAFLYLLIVQGFFSGLTIGKLSEENIKAGIKHSFVLMVMSFLISTVASLIFG